MKGAGFGRELLPGDICTQGGVYQVTHHAHRAPHKVAVRKGDSFPRCNRCGDAVRFRLLTKETAPAPSRKRTAGHGS
jgi:hypothetical protein